MDPDPVPGPELSMSPTSDVDVVVVGSGPNGLAAAVTFARAGLGVRVLEAQASVGGGARTVPGLRDGVTHDLCSAVHPLAIASPFFRRFDLEARGVQMLTPDVSYAQPLPDGRAGVAYRSLERTIEGLGTDGPAWRGLMGPLVAHAGSIVGAVLGDHRRLPPRVLDAVPFGLRTLEQGLPWLWDRRFRTPEGAALLTGVAAHGITPLPSLPAAGTAMFLGMLAHATGWVVPRGGTQRITDALVADLVAHGGEVVTSRPVRTTADLGRARAYVFDTAPGTVAQVLGGRLPTTTSRAYRRFRHGNAAAKVDLVLSGPVPWRNADVRRAGTVHVGGTRAQMVAAERAVHAGRHAAPPMVLVSDPGVVDPGRVAPDGTRPLWAYAHVPAGSSHDVTEDVVGRIEEYAPGFRDVVLEARCLPATDLALHNANYVGGDIAAGALTLPRMLLGPRPPWDPYRTGAEGVYLCSASVPPGPGVHGMGGWHAARRVLREMFGVHEPPELSPA